MPQDIHAADANAAIKRACDPCRAKKIKCDKEKPCSNCRIAKRNCVATGFGQNHSGSRERVLISTKYEQKIDGIDRRLDSIERILGNISHSLRDNTEGHGFDDFNTSLPPEHSNQILPHVAIWAEGTHYLHFEGESSLTAHTISAGDFIKQKMHRTTDSEFSPSMESAMLALKKIINAYEQGSPCTELVFPHQHPLPRNGLAGLPMPPLHILSQLLHEAKDTMPLFFSVTCSFMSLGSLIEYCREVCFVPNHFNISSFIIANGGLYYLLSDKARSHSDPRVRDEYYGYRKMCAGNLGTALSNMGIFMPATLESLRALLMGANFALEASRPLVAWRMICMTAEICQTLGYHRLTRPDTLSNTLDEYHSKSALFTYAYVLDKGLALRLGRASSFNDQDIILPAPKADIFNKNDAWEFISQMSVRHAQLQGQIYLKLYSTEAVTASSEHRSHCAKTLADEVRAVMAQHLAIRQGLSSAASNGPLRASGAQKELAPIFESDIVSCHATLTLIYRAIPLSSKESGSSNSACVDSARAAFYHHQECMQLIDHGIEAQVAYINWTILFAPFTPLIVIFCHTIDSLNADDLDRLDNFANSLQPLSTTSEAIEQLHRLAQSLHRIASLFVKHRLSQPDHHQSNHVEDDFNEYLTQLGLIPSVFNQTEPGQQLAPGAMDGTQLGDWFAWDVNLIDFSEVA